jgi:hypothetical protein
MLFLREQAMTFLNYKNILLKLLRILYTQTTYWYIKISLFMIGVFECNNEYGPHIFKSSKVFIIYIDIYIYIYLFVIYLMALSLAPTIYRQKLDD